MIFLARGFWISRLQDTLDGPFPCLGKSDVEGYFEGPYYEWFRFNKVVFSDSCWLKWHRERERERERERDCFLARVSVEFVG